MPWYGKISKVYLIIKAKFRTLCMVLLMLYVYFAYSGVCLLFCSLKRHVRNSLKESGKAERSFNFILYQRPKTQMPKEA